MNYLETEHVISNADIDQIFAESKAITDHCEDYIVKDVKSKNFGFTHPFNVTYLPQDNIRRQVGISDFAFGQLCNKIGVPVSYMKKCLEQKEYDIVHDNMHMWLDRFNKDLFLREYKNQIRGILSTRYSVLDTPEVLDVLFNGDMALSDFNVKGCHISSERFHLRITENQQLIEKDDLFAGVQVDSSDVGRSQLRVQFLIYKLVCTNGLATSTDNSIFFQQKHIGITQYVG